jgi:hypothetical protein
MFFRSDKRMIPLGMPSPKDKHKVGPYFIQLTDYLFDKDVPADHGVRSRTMGFNCKCSVKKEHTRLSPRSKVPIMRHGVAKIVHILLKDISKRRRERMNIRISTKSQSIGYTGCVVGVLPKDNTLNLIEGSKV